MRRSWASLTVGALVLVMIVLTYFLVRLVGEKTLSKEGISVYALFNDASGLFEKSRVQTAGISVGQIEKPFARREGAEGQDHHPHRARQHAV